MAQLYSQGILETFGSILWPTKTHLDADFKCLFLLLKVCMYVYISSVLLMTSLESVKDSDLLEMTSLKKPPSETRTEALLVIYVAYFGICQ